MTQQRIKDSGSVLKYFAAIPHMADEDLDLYEYRLYGHYKHICGELNNPCDESVRETAKRCHMSHPMVIKTRRALADKGYIHCEQADVKSPVSITIADVWPPSSMSLVRALAVRCELTASLVNFLLIIIG